MTSRRAQRRARPDPPDPPRFLRQIYDPHLGTLDLFARGPTPGGTILAVPSIDERWPAEIKNAIERRRRATLYAQCDCGGRVRRPPLRPGEAAEQTFEHEDDCAATDEALGVLFTRYGIDPLAPPQTAN